MGCLPLKAASRRSTSKRDREASLLATIALSKTGYSLGRKIGKGSFSKVVKATYKNGHDKCMILACKIVNLEKAPMNSLGFIRRELNILTKIGHPHIVRIHSILEREPNIYIFMDYAENGDLSKHIKFNGPVNENKSRKWFSQMVGAVQYLHSVNIAHRDLKCNNILLTKEMNVKVADFSLARYCYGGNDLSQTYCGSRAYTAPEILTGIPYDPKLADLWSLGVILFRMLNETLPFKYANLSLLIAAQNNKQFKFHHRLEGRVSDDAKKVVSCLLEPDTKLRWSLNRVVKSPWLCGYHPTESANNHYLSEQSTSYISVASSMEICRGSVQDTSQLLTTLAVPKKPRNKLFGLICCWSRRSKQITAPRVIFKELPAAELVTFSEPSKSRMQRRNRKLGLKVRRRLRSQRCPKNRKLRLKLLRRRRKNYNNSMRIGK